MYLSPNKICKFPPIFVTFLEITGSKIGSKVAGQFSIMSNFPINKDYSNVL